MRGWKNDVDNDRLLLAELPRPTPGPGELLVEMRAAGLNRAELAMRSGRYRPGFGSAEVNGLEGAGVVVEAGPGCTRFARGARVMGMCSGSYAEYALMDDAIALAVPEALAFDEAAALPVGCCTSYDALALAARLAGGEGALVTAATSGVGDLAVKIARLLGATPVIGTSRSPERAARLATTAVLCLGGVGLGAAVREASGGEGVGVVIDHVGGPDFGELIEACAVGGRIVSVGRLAGGAVACNLDEVARKRLSIVGVTFRTRSRAQYGEIAQATDAALGRAIADGSLRAHIDAIFPFEEAPEAHRALAAGAHVGKLVLHIRD